MKKLHITIIALAMAVCAGCGKENPEKQIKIEGLTLENFPVMDGSTSTDPLVRMTASRLLGYKCKWERPEDFVTWSLSTDLPESFVKQNLKCSQTHNSFINLIDGSADMIFSARSMSPDEKAYADRAGISLIETPIALDALIFMEHPSNPVNSLTHAQLESIYMARTTNWKEVGGQDEPIVPFVRNKNSGSQELMESLVMTEPIPDGFYEDLFDDYQIVISMFPVFTNVSGTHGGLGYTVYYYKENMVRDRFNVKTLSVNGIYPDKTTIKKRTYPFVAEVCLIIRSDLDKSSMAYKIYEFMQTETGKRIISESGYIPN